MRKSETRNSEIYFTVKIYDKDGIVREIEGEKILKAVTYTIVDKILQKDDIASIEMEDEDGLTLTHADNNDTTKIKQKNRKEKS